MDAALMPHFCRQRRPPSASCLAYNLGNFLRTLAMPEAIKDWSLTSLKEKLIKIGAKVVSHGRYVAFQMAEIAIPRNLFADILRLIGELRPPPITSTGQCVRLSRVPPKTRGDVRLDDRRFGIPQRATVRRLAPKRIYKPWRGLNDISVLSKSYYLAVSVAIRPSSGECRMNYAAG
jgi:hypothetical protein